MNKLLNTINTYREKFLSLPREKQLIIIAAIAAYDLIALACVLYVLYLIF